MEELKIYIEYMTLKELKEIRAIIDRYIAKKERQLKLIKSI
uniref:Uncharacterized protein n=1 Tax=viral metagenome TaxID=1070528 RepID=A0A6M3LXQ2_9ZZZZ